MAVAASLGMRVGSDIPERLQFGAGMAIMGIVFAVVQVLLVLERIGEAVAYATRSAAEAYLRDEARSA